MAQPRKRQIKLSTLEKQFNDTQKMHTHLINKETGEYVKYNLRFDKQEVEKLISELNEHLLYSQENNIDYFKNDDEFLKYAFYLIIKHFSHFKDEISDKFEDNIKAMNKLLSTGLFEKFYKEVFDMNEVWEVIDKINEIMQLSLKITELENEKRQEILKQVENKEIIKHVSGFDVDA